MLATGVFSVGIKFRTAIPIQKLCTSIKTYSTSSGSSSGSSSDSDSDNETIHKIKKNEQFNKTPNKSRQRSRTLGTLIDNVMKKSNNIEVPNVAIPLKETIKRKKLNTKENLSYASELLKAAEKVADVLGGNKEDNKWKLLDRLEHTQRPNKDQGKPYSVQHLNQLLLDIREKDNDSKFSKTKQSKDKTAPQLSISQTLYSEEKKKQLNARSPATATTENQHEYRHKIRKGTDRSKAKLEDMQFYKLRSVIFKDMKENTNVPELSTWESLEQRELNLMSNQPPRNVFQEMIQWTESGKLWRFPIDNEYGMKEESNVHFSEHVFLERHLKDWCPTRGPIRHYMELVCTGLSKNPYMTVDEKIGHITWYKEYFSEKTELLRELGAIDVTSNDEKQIKT